LEKKEKEYFRSQGISILSSYANIIVWRNQFAHEGIIPSTATYDEVKKSYELGKNVVDCLATAMRR